MNQNCERWNGGVAALQLFVERRVIDSMKSFLKVVLLVIVAVIAVKLVPLTFALGCVLAAGVLGLIAVGASAIAALAGAVITLVAVLSPIWVPALAIVGLIALIKRCTRRNGGLAV